MWSLPPRGRAFAATAARAENAGDVPASLAPESEAAAVVRVSRALGLPELLPDLVGVAIRVLDARGPGRHQDVLLSSSGRGPLLRHLALPRRSVHGAFCTTLLGYRLGKRLRLLAAEIRVEPDPGGGVPLSKPPAEPSDGARVVVDLL